MDDELQFTDDCGVEWHKYTCSYIDREGKNFCFHMWAKDDSDAQERMASIRENAQVDGQIDFIIDDETESYTPIITH